MADIIDLVNYIDDLVFLREWERAIYFLQRTGPAGGWDQAGEDWPGKRDF